MFERNSRVSSQTIDESSRGQGLRLGNMPLWELNLRIFRYVVPEQDLMAKLASLLRQSRISKNHGRTPYLVHHHVGSSQRENGQHPPVFAMTSGCTSSLYHFVASSS